MRVIAVASVLLASSVHAAPCPAGKALRELASTAFPGEDVAGASCRLVRTADGARWLIEVSTRHGLEVALGARGRVAWSCCGYTPGTPGASLLHVDIADLDGDGRDELIATVAHEGHERYRDEQLYVHAASDPLVLYERGSIELARSAPGQAGCHSRWRIVRAPHGTHHLAIIGGCADAGRELAWRDGALVES
ncbi:MAG TPA: hypothetical protein VMJ10_33450 [Kofleriaceae bacterium]|nr:hypothetical protein [Kofleriaceae bacterium]